jgi:tetratricopeptide (TPR) repeat protein
VVWFACVVAPAPVATAAAPPTESRLAEAKQHYAAATKFYDLAEYENALREFKEAYRAVEDPAFLFNIAQCHRKLGNNPEAITFYRTYLRRAPHAANRTEVEKRIAELERAPAAPAPPPTDNVSPTADTPVAPLVLDLPAPAPAPAPAPQAELVASPAPAPATETPFYRRGWFWIVTGAVVAGAATTLIVLSTRSDEAPFCPDCAGTTAIAP